MKTFKYAVLTKLQIAVLNGMEAEECVVTNETIEMLEQVFGIWNFTDVEDLRAIRNSVVKYFSDLTKRDCISADGTKWLENSYDLHQAYSTKSSMTVAVIDRAMYQMAKSNLI